MEILSLQLFPIVWIFPRFQGVLYYNRWGLSRSQKLLQGLVSLELTAYLSVFDLFLTRLIMTTYYQKDVNFESHNFLKLSFTNIRGLHPFFIMLNFPRIKFSRHSCSIWGKLGWLNWSWQFPCEGLSSFIRKDSAIHMHGFAVYVKEGLPFAWGLSLEKSADSYVFDWLYFTQCLTFNCLTITCFHLSHLTCLTISFFIFMYSFWCYLI